MGKGKLRRFEEMNTFENVIQAPFEEVFKKDFHLKNNWHKEVFKNNHPIVLELGCGKGEYTLGLAQKFPEKNFIGIDIKGARMWKGASEALHNKLENTRFLRTRIEFITAFFARDEISEIWITFPDPQIKKRRNKKRLTSSRFLNAYKQILKEDGVIHLKTDSAELYSYTQEIIHFNKLNNIYCTEDLYHSDLQDEILNIHTFYEQMFLDEGKKITYTKFSLQNCSKITEPPDEEE